MTENEQNQIELYLSTGKYQQALELHNSIEKNRPLNDDEILTKKLAQIYIYLDKGEFEDGIKLADKMINEAQIKSNKLREIDAILGKVENSILLVLFNESSDLIKQGNDLLNTLKEIPISQFKKRKAYFLFLEGKINYSRNKIEESFNNFEKSLELFKEIDDKFHMVYTYQQLGFLKTLEEDFTLSKKFINESMTLAKQLDIDIAITWNLILLARIEFYIRNLANSISYKKKVFEMCDKIDNKFITRACLQLFGYCYYEKGNYNKALSYFKKSISLMMEIRHDIRFSRSFYMMGKIYSLKGELKKALEYYNKVLNLSLTNLNLQSEPAYLMMVGKTYGELGDYTSAKKNLLNALNLTKEVQIINIFFSYERKSSLLSRIYHYLISLALAYEDSENIHQYLNELKKLSLINSKQKHYNLLYKLDKALILKTSNRLSDKGQAINILREIIHEEINDNEIYIESMINLIELLIYELEVSAEKEVLQEIIEFSDKLLNIAKSQDLHYLLAETYFFKAKTALIKLDIKDTRILLTKAQSIAEKFGLKRLAYKISNKHDSILMHLEEWEEKIKHTIPLQEKIKDQQHEFLFTKSLSFKMKELTFAEEIPVYFLILASEGGISLYHREFQEIKVDDSFLIAGFISAINSFGKETFSSKGSIDRIKHGDFLITLQSKKSLLFAYIFKGESYSAISKLDEFIKVILSSDTIVQKLNQSIKRHIQLSNDTNQLIDQKINQIFLVS